MNFVPVTDVKLNDPIWSRQFGLVRDVVLPYMWQILNDNVDNAEKSHCVENFKIAAGLSSGKFYGAVFQDTDLYKWIEAVSYVLSVEKNPHLEALADEAINLIAAAQQPDGYVNTYYTCVVPDKRWTNLMEGHELYCAGHMIEAGVAYFQATGKDKFLKICRNFASLIDRTFGKDKMRGYPGHPEIELALIRLYEATGEKRFLDLAGYFIDERGTGENLFIQECRRKDHSFIFPEMAHFKEDYFQSHLPVRQQKNAAGHAVRAMYLYSAMTDYARLKGDQELSGACKHLYQNTVSRQMYVTGGVGAAKLGERFTVDYDLPPDSAYTETCASIGLMFFASRMWLLTGEKGCYDIWEQALNNNVLSGMGRDGQHFFYVNPLEVVPQNIKHNPSLSHVKTQRQKWFSVACCPPNLARILSSLSGYIYAMEDDRLYVLTHIGSKFEKGGLYVNLQHNNDEYTLTIDGDPKEVYLRLPENSILSNSQAEIQDNGYAVLRHPGGKMQYHYTLTPQIRVLQAHPAVSAAAGQLCVQRGLTTYCVEGIDNQLPLSALRLPNQSTFIEEKAGWLGDDWPVLRTDGVKLSDNNWEGVLYNSQSSVYESCRLTFIPYSQWANRGENEMRVWLIEK